MVAGVLFVQSPKAGAPLDGLRRVHLSLRKGLFIILGTYSPSSTITFDFKVFVTDNNEIKDLTLGF